VTNFKYGNFDIKKFNFENGNFEFEFNFELDMAPMGWGGGVGVTADDVRGCYDPVYPILGDAMTPFYPVLVVFFVEVKFEVTIGFC